MLVGYGFLLLPNNAVGIISFSNDNPLQFRYTLSAYHTYSILVESDSRAILTFNDSSAVGSNSYLGGIVSHDGSELYWVNNTKPLP